MHQTPFLAAKVLFRQRIQVPYSRLFGQWEDCGIAEAFVLEDLYSDPDFQYAARNSPVHVSLIVQTLFPGAAGLPEGDPGLALLADGREARGAGEGAWYSALCPRGGRQPAPDQPNDPVGRLLERIKPLLRRYPPHGVNLDFIRYFVFWEEVMAGTAPDALPQSCFCPSCTGAFGRQAGIELPKGLTVPETASLILEHYPDQWTHFKTATIAALVDHLVAELGQTMPEPRFRIHTVPWLSGEFGQGRERIAGQDLGLLASSVAAFSPMCYHQMLRRTPQWIHQVVSDHAAAAPNAAILPAIQALPMYLDTPITPEEFATCLGQALLPPSSGVLIWPWESLTAEQLEIVKKTR